MEENGQLVQFLFNTEREVIAEKEKTWQLYIRGSELLASSNDYNQTYYYYASDEMGSITHLADNRKILNKYEYDAWGNVVSQKETVPNKFQFNGQQLDPITGQYYLRARFYNPVIGRFTQEDTYRGDGLNLNAYCANNPVYYVDTTGNAKSNSNCPSTIVNAQEARDGNTSQMQVEGVSNPKWNSTELLDELSKSGAKYNPDDVISVTKTVDGKLVWLENGNSNAGLEYIMSHADNFASKGIPKDQIKDLVMEALNKGKVVGYQGRGQGRPIYEIIFNGEKHRVAITVGDNGFIVGANLSSIK